MISKTTGKDITTSACWLNNRTENESPEENLWIIRVPQVRARAEPKEYRLCCSFLLKNHLS